jgi:hypothetical protein
MNLGGTTMRDKQNHPLSELPVSNYGSAVAKALDWLGDRYLLAKPINARSRIARPGSTIGPQQLKGV